MAKHQRSGSGKAPSQAAIAGIRTFSRLPALAPSFDGEIDLAFLGVPFDGLVTYRQGARSGPNAIRQASVLCRNYSQQMEVAVFDRLRAYDAGDLDVNPYDYREAFLQIEDGIRRLQRRGASVVSLGGDHSILLPILRATVAQHSNLTLIQFDAHSDTSDEGWHGQKYHHGTTIRRAIEEGVLEGSRVFQIGIRGFIASAEYNDFSRHAGIRVLNMQEVHDSRNRKAFLETIRSVAGGGPCYLSFDVDGVDPAFAPGTGTPVIGGLTSFEAIDMMRGFRGLKFVGGDVVEVAPAYDHAEITALLGAAIALEVGALIALARG